ncbi:MAG: D-lactate dehydrogenase [Rickettsiales bacterium TMED254]|nr:D-lactate dehydrogenase [Rickettsiales bacterium]RPF76357.1 MAG: D-lactate dehydrogenase [Rickettsiales bacterium TMED254]
MTLNLHDKIIHIVGIKNFLINEKEKTPYTTGWRTKSGECEFVVLPNSLFNMWRVLKLCVENNKYILMQAANTSLTGGSTPNGKYDKGLVIINTTKLKTIIPIKNGKQVLAFPGSTLYDLEKKIKPYNRAPHSEIGSSCIGASVVGGVCNNSGGALIKRGPAYTELSLFASVSSNGKLELKNKLGVDLGKYPEEILKNLDTHNFNEENIKNSNFKASSTDYKNIIKDTNANSPARYNADKRRLYDASGCSGKLAVFAVRLDTFEKENEERTFYYSTNNPEDLTILRKNIIIEVDELPIYAEYMHKDAYEVSKKFGKDAFYLIYYLGTSTMPFFYRTKSNLESFFEKSKFFSHRSLDFLLNAIVSILPNQMPKKFDKLNKKFKHHLILKCDQKIFNEILKISKNVFNRNKENNFLICSPKESKKLTLNRYVFAGASARCANLSKYANSELLPLDVALKRNDDNWFHDISMDSKKDILKTLTVAHFFCLVFHREYVVKKGKDNNKVKKKLLDWFDKIGAKYPAEHNVGHVYKADNNLKKFYKKLDPNNIFNPGIGKTSKCLEKKTNELV